MIFFCSDCEPARTSPEVTRENAKKLWELSAKLVNLEQK